MSDDDSVLVRGREVDPSDLAVGQQSNGYRDIAQGLAYCGFALFLLGPFLAVQNLPTDLSTTTAADLQPATDPMLVGVLLVSAGGLLAVLTSRPVAEGYLRLRGESTESVVVAAESEEDPATDGGEPVQNSDKDPLAEADPDE